MPDQQDSEPGMCLSDLADNETLIAALRHALEDPGPSPTVSI